MFADRELVPDRVTGAAEFLSADDRSCLQALDGIEHESPTPEAHSRPRSGLACGSEAKPTISHPATRRLGAILSDRAFAAAAAHAASIYHLIGRLLNRFSCTSIG